MWWQSMRKGGSCRGLAALSSHPAVGAVSICLLSYQQAKGCLTAASYPKCGCPDQQTSSHWCPQTLGLAGELEWVLHTRREGPLSRRCLGRIFESSDADTDGQGPAFDGREGPWLGCQVSPEAREGSTE